MDSCMEPDAATNVGLQRAGTKPQWGVCSLSREMKGEKS